MNRRIDRLLQYCLRDSAHHLSDERLADLFCGNLRIDKKWMARRHLASCQDCRMRQENLLGPRAELMLQLYGEILEQAEFKLPETPRFVFSRWLDRRIRQAESPRKHDIQPLRSSFVFPVALIGVAGLLAGALGFSLWPRERTLEGSANALLQRAEGWERPGAAVAPGIARQTVQIKTPRLTVKRSVYWDLQGKRKLKQTALPVAEEELRTTLGYAGVDWDRPISASAYQTWRDRQQERSDRVVSSGVHLLTLTTTVPEGVVSEQSLTVRDTDFHPVQRRISFRNSQTVEIAELDFKVLPWSAVEANVFEPSENIPIHVATDVPSVLSPFHLPANPSLEELDETELMARLILNQLHADTGEQIEIHHSPSEVEVEGLVETEERKRELTSQLITLPHLKVSIQSAAELRAIPSSAPQSIRVQTDTLPVQSSALESYLRPQGRSVKDINSLAQRFFNNALTISQESNAILSLRLRFAATEQRPIIASATLQELLYSHRERLKEALRQQRELLEEIGALSQGNREVTSAATASLASGAARNLELAKELTQTNIPAVRSADAIFAEMSTMADCIADAARETYAQAKENDAQTTKKN